MGLYAVVFRTSDLIKAAKHPIFLTIYILLIVALLIEFIHDNADYYQINRLTITVLGSVVYASLCRDRTALRLIIYSYILTSLLLSIGLIVTSFGLMRIIEVGNIQEAGAVRQEIYVERPLGMNWNKMAVVISQGAIIALIVANSKRSMIYTWVFYALAFLSAIGVFLTMSRSGAAILIITALYVTFLIGRIRLKNFVSLILIVVVLAYLIPSTAVSRYEFTDWSLFESPDARMKLLRAAIDHFPEYALSGVGSGNYWGLWGRLSGFGGTHGVLCAHNYFIQVWVYWGILAFLCVLLICWMARKYLPRNVGSDELKLGVKSMLFLLFVYMFTASVIRDKSFAIGIGILVGSNIWVFAKKRLIPRYRVPGHRASNRRLLN